jgi:hypothetical protein
MLLDYQDYKILIQDGNFIRLALILSSEASDNLKKAQNDFISRFEEQFYNYLKDFNGEVTPFLKEIPLIDEIFRFSLVNPHIVDKKPPIIRLKSFQERIISVANLLESDGNYFFISNLINYITSVMPKEPREKIIANIYDLREQHIIIPIEVK